MIPLFALSVISLTLIIERAWFWGRTHGPTRMRKLEKLNDALRRGEQKEALRMVLNDRSPFAEVVRRLMIYGASDAVSVEIVEAQRPRFDR